MTTSPRRPDGRPATGSGQPGAIRDQLRRLRAEGGTYRAIAAASGLARTTVYDLASGRRPPTSAAERALRTVTSNSLHRARVDAGGSRLRLRALHVMGHGSARIARALGVREMTIRALVRGDAATMSIRLRDAIIELYEAWWDKRAPERTRFERGAATAARRRAIAGNWCAGAGLDDDELDTPGYRPARAGNPPSAPAPPPTSARPHDPGRTSAHEQRPTEPPAPRRGCFVGPERPVFRSRQPLPRRPAMTLTLHDDSISGDHTDHTARLVPGRERVWEVSWLPGRRMDCNSAVTAMVLADTAGPGGLRPGHRLWRHAEVWAADLGLTTPDALARIAQPPAGISTGKDAAEPAGPEAGQ